MYTVRCTYVNINIEGRWEQGLRYDAGLEDAILPD